MYAEKDLVKLWQHLEYQPCVGSFSVEIPARHSTKHARPRAPRVATVELRFVAFTLNPPKRLSSKLPDLAMYAIYVREKAPPAGVPPLEWMLLTNLPIENFAQAYEKGQWYCLRWRIEIVQTQMTKRDGFPLRAGGHDVADFHLAVADDDPINEQCGQLSTLSKRQLVECRADAVAKGLDAMGQGGHIHLLLCLEIELAQLLSQPLLGLSHLLVFAFEFVPTDDGGQIDLQQARLLPFQLRQGLPQRLAPGVEGVRQPLPALGPCQFMSNQSGLSQHPTEILPHERVQGMGRGIARRAAVVGSCAQGIASPPTSIVGIAGGEGAAHAGQLTLAATDQAA